MKVAGCHDCPMSGIYDDRACLHPGVESRFDVLYEYHDERPHEQCPLRSGPLTIELDEEAK